MITVFPRVAEDRRSKAAFLNLTISVKVENEILVGLLTSLFML